MSHFSNILNDIRVRGHMMVFMNQKASQDEIE
jgi:hypothetical protein